MYVSEKCEYILCVENRSWPPTRPCPSHCPCNTTFQDGYPSTKVLWRDTRMSLCTFRMGERQSVPVAVFFFSLDILLVARCRPAPLEWTRKCIYPGTLPSQLPLLRRPSNRPSTILITHTSSGWVADAFLWPSRLFLLLQVSFIKSSQGQGMAGKDFRAGRLVRHLIVFPITGYACMVS